MIHDDPRQVLHTTQNRYRACHAVSLVDFHARNKFCSRAGWKEPLFVEIQSIAAVGYMQ